MYEVKSPRVRSQFEAMMKLEKVRKVLDFIKADERNSIDELKELVLIEAPTHHEEKRAAVFAQKLKDLGLEDVHTGRGGCVIGLRRGSGNGPKVVIEGHLDTVFPFGSVKGVEERDGFLYAPGVGDDTRALAMLLSLLRGLNAVNVKTTGDVYFVGTTREEGTGALGGMKDFLDEHPEIDISLSVDSNDMSRIIYEATLCQTWEFTFRGQGGHAWSAFGTVAQPVHAAARAVAKIAALEVPSSPKTTFAVSNFHAGNISGVHAIASEASFIINFRSNGAEEFAAVKKAVFDAVESSAREESQKWGKNEIEVSSRILCDIPGGTQDAHSPLVETAWLSLSALEATPWLEEGGSTNANIAISKGIPALCMGRAWAPDENSKRVHNHSLDEKLHIVNAHKAVQHLALVLLMAAGIDGEFGSIVTK